MPADVVIPQLGESISEGEILEWRVTDGDTVAVDDILLELETDKTTVEIPSPAAGVVRILKPKGAVVAVGEVIARIEAAGASAGASKPAAQSAPVQKAAPAAKAAAAPAPAAKAAAVAAAKPAPAPPAAPTPPPPAAAAAAAPATRLGPAARRMAEEQHVDPASLHGTGPGGRATKADVAAAAESRQAEPPPAAVAATAPAAAKPAPARVAAGDDEEERTRMSRMRRTIAERLVSAQHTAAILTTFNEVDMSAAMELRARHKEAFQKAHGVSLGFMSIFARACILALRDVPVVGARIEGDEVVTSKRVHLGIAASTERGLVVPIVRNADLLSMAGLEQEVGRLAGLARESKLQVEDLSGGTFTISNGGVFGSLLSTPILNPPQSGILGMHKIEKRPVVVGDQIVIRPMMYLALSYDHRIVDGREAVTFLVKVKERIEDPSRLLLEI